MHLANKHNINVTWHTCDQPGCDFKTKKTSNLTRHLRTSGQARHRTVVVFDPPQATNRVVIPDALPAVTKLVTFIAEREGKKDVSRVQVNVNAGNRSKPLLSPVVPSAAMGGGGAPPGFPPPPRNGISRVWFHAGPRSSLSSNGMYWAMIERTSERM